MIYGARVSARFYCWPVGLNIARARFHRGISNRFWLISVNGWTDSRTQNTQADRKLSATIHLIKLTNGNEKQDTKSSKVREGLSTRDSVVSIVTLTLFLIGGVKSLSVCICISISPNFFIFICKHSQTQNN